MVFALYLHGILHVFARVCDGSCLGIAWGCFGDCFGRASCASSGFATGVVRCVPDLLGSIDLRLWLHEAAATGPENVDSLRILAVFQVSRKNQWDRIKNH